MTTDSSKPVEKQEEASRPATKQPAVLWNDPRKRERGVEPNKLGVATPNKVG